jgi:hypothetical protein
MKSRSHVLALLAALLVPAGCSLGGRVHCGDVWLGVGHGLAFVGNRAKLAIH